MEKISFKHGGKTIGFRESGGQWRRDVWNKAAGRAITYYFGRVADDPTGQRAMYGPEIGWLAREGSIRSGLDRLHSVTPTGSMTLAQAARLYLEAKHRQLIAGERAPETFNDYVRELQYLVDGMGGNALLDAIGPSHFTAYMDLHLRGKRKLKAHRMSTTIRYVKAFFHYAVKQGWRGPVNFGADFVPPSTDPDAIAARAARKGEEYDGDCIFEPAHIDFLLERATPLFKAMILLSLNTGIGPSDIAKLQWKDIDLETGMFSSRRGKNGIRREAYLWKKTRRALERVKGLKRNRLAYEKEGEEALIFITRMGEPMISRKAVMDGDRVRKFILRNSISGTFGRWVREGKGRGIIPAHARLGYYNLRHSYYTHAENSPDLNAVSRTMGHALHGMGRRYKRKAMPLPRLKKVAMRVYRAYWPKATKPVPATMRYGETNVA